MLKNVNLILPNEDEILYEKQQNLITEFETTPSSEILIKIALLQTVFPICDSISAIRIMEKSIMDDVQLLIIGAHLCAECLDMEENIFLNKLLEREKELVNEHKSIVKYLVALQEYNRTHSATKKVISNLEESIELCDRFVSNYYFKYLLFHNTDDRTKAQSNVLKVLSVEECEALTLDEMITGTFYIEEHVTMQSLSKPAFDGLFVEAY